jgi:hypothetical protein
MVRAFGPVRMTAVFSGQIMDWIDYNVERPTTEGVFEWRVPSIALPDAIVIVAAHMRKRGAGYKDVISPKFDYWDGYRVHVPKGLQWRDTVEHKGIKSFEQKLLGVEGVSHCDCIYCGKTPTLHAVQWSSGGGVVVGAAPQYLNSWWLECCAWGKTPHLSDPREIERVRRAAIARATGNEDTPQ